MKIKFIKFKTVNSTNDVAIRLIKKKNFKPTLVLSENQIKGRGTMGKKWVSQKGNLFISIFFKINQKKINFRQYAILNAYILKSIIKKIVAKNITIKWPNDLLYKKKHKICGILQEVVSFKSYDFLIIGIGLNTNVSPKNNGLKAVSLKSIISKKIDNTKITINIKKKYEVFLDNIEKLSYINIKKRYCK
tara:strand:- start:644 stop:1213 length:570 start_codon:yes stop_codon:yes gene_type:complete